MIFNLVNKYKYLLPVIYCLGGVLLLGTLVPFFCAQITCEKCSMATVNPSSFLMPLFAYGSIGLVGLTIGFTRKTASEKNALDFDKTRSELNDAFSVIAIVRKKLVSHDSKVDRRKAYDYMQGLEAAVKAEREQAQAQATPEASESQASAEAGAAVNFAFMMNQSTTPEGANSFIFWGLSSDPNVAPANRAASEAPTKKGGKAEPTAQEVSVAAFKILNSFEGCANAIRYGIYDEDFIYNVYGSQFIDFYELTYGLMKARQRELPRAWVNYEWLAVKWTLRRKITGVTSKEWEETSYIIQESLAAIKEHTKVRPDPGKLQKFMNKLERRKFPA
ncbi:DUF4760 domain-containing protein [Pseudomonas rhizophila]